MSETRGRRSEAEPLEYHGEPLRRLEPLDLVDATPFYWPPELLRTEPLRDNIPRAPMCRCTVLPIEPEGD